MGCCIGRKKVLPAKQSKRSVSIASRRVWQTQRGEKDATRRDVKVNPSVEQKYTIFSLIGKGEFGHVLRVEHKQSKIPYAIKVIDLTRDIKASSQLELEILTKVKHKYVIRLYDYQRSSTRLYLVMDLATGGELMDRISLMGNFDECDATRVLYMILDGLKYLHSLGITHRDMKPENILYYHPGADSKIIITDFGLSAMRAASQSPASYLMKTDCGTIEYMAPEVITRNRYTNAVDMWSMGVIAFIILSGRLPFPLNGNIMSTLRMICFCKFDFEGEVSWEKTILLFGTLLVRDGNAPCLKSNKFFPVVSTCMVFSICKQTYPFGVLTLHSDIDLMQRMACIRSGRSYFC